MLNMGIFGTIITHTNTQLDRDNTLRIECVIEFNLMKYSYYEIFFSRIIQNMPLDVLK